MPRRRRKSSWPVRITLAILAIPALYIFAALIGALIPMNSGWTEPDEGVTIYVADNGVHADLGRPQPEDRSRRADRRRAGHACRMVARPHLRREGNPADWRAISPPLGID